VPVVFDTGILYAYYDRSDAWHAPALALVRVEARGLIVPAPVVPEVDHLLGHRLGARARQVFYRGLADGDYVIADLPLDRYERVAELNRRFADLDLGFVDAAVVAIAEAIGVPRIATADRRHFEPLGAALSLEILPKAR
jgi:predicted nucleic acid-binding protein